MHILPGSLPAASRQLPGSFPAASRQPPGSFPAAYETCGTAFQTFLRKFLIQQVNTHDGVDVPWNQHS